MINVVFDTNAWMFLFGKKPIEKGRINDLRIEGYNIWDREVNRILPFAVKGELYSLAAQGNWGKQRLEIIEITLSDLIVANSNEKIIQAYIEIDSFSLNRHPTKALPNDLTDRVMGKNDLWIAAIALTANGYLVSNDNDFDHLVHLGLKVAKF